MILITLAWADIKRTWLGACMLVLMIAVTIALAVVINLEERGLRLGSARASEAFDLVIGAAGSETQLVLSTVFLQPSLLPLMPGKYRDKIGMHPQVLWSAPLAFGDFYEGAPIIGTTEALVTQGSTVSLAEGRSFKSEYEAVVGFASKFKLGDVIKPMHGQIGSESAHGHEGVEYTVVGRLPFQNNTWDAAILVPIETVWHVHGITDHDEVGTHETDGHETDGHHADLSGMDERPLISAMIVKPKTVAGAYQLRSEFRGDDTIAVFPAEILTQLYTILGDIHQLLSVIALGAEGVLYLCIIFVAITHVNQRKRPIAALRTFGAPRYAIFMLIWGQLMLLVITGVIVGAVLGYGVSVYISEHITAKSGFNLPIMLTQEDIRSLLFSVVFAAIAALIPALLSYKHSPVHALRSSG